ncbi:(d)CMP kinase [Candidatus Woesearchaeota archaeon]|nr:(d)CMP kinase [Candidatus Woesearchaeota archaeon]
MKITISGTAGSGKSSVAKLLAKRLHYKHFSMGDFQRKLALEKGMTIAELGSLEATDKKYDIMVDDKQKQIGKDNDDFIMDSWLAPLFVPDSFKVFLDADIKTRVNRRLKQKRDEESFSDFDSAKKTMSSREKVNRERWLEFYDYDFSDMKNYNLVIDTTEIEIEDVVNRIIANLDKR